MSIFLNFRLFLKHVEPCVPKPFRVGESAVGSSLSMGCLSKAALFIKHITVVLYPEVWAGCCVFV